MEELVNKKIELHFSEIKYKIINTLSIFLINKPESILSLLQIEDDYYFYGINTGEFVREFVNKLYEENTEGERKMKIYSKRTNMNTIVINFGHCPLKIIIININNDINIINSKNPSKYYFLNLHRSFHTLSFPDIYNFIKNYEKILELHYLLEQEISTSMTKKIQIPKRDIYINKYIKEILYPFSEDIINIGTIAFQKIYSIFSDFIPYPEIVCAKNFYEIYTEFKNAKYKCVLLKSDFEFYNYNFLVYNKDKIILRVYNGENFCYPFTYIGGNKYGTYPLLMKYLCLHVIYKGKSADKYINLINNVHKEQQKKGGLLKSLNPKCVGESISSYKQYYLRNWGKKPWNYTKNILY